VDHGRHPAVRVDRVIRSGARPAGGQRPAGLQARYVGSGDGKLRLVPLWESKEHADRHLGERLGPTLAQALGPEFIEIDVARSCVWEPVAWPTPGHTSRQAVSDPTVC
jgi:hypothetical protein